ncbi:MAG: DUF4386 family protein [Planctomycetota bacterium]|jgi:hypothetical protein
MMNLQKMGGIAALYVGAAYVVAVVGYLLVVGDIGVVDPVQNVALLVDNQAFLYILNLITYVVTGVFLVVLSLALYERLKAGSPAMVQTATAFGLIWAAVIIVIGMVSNNVLGVVVDLYGKDPAQAASVWLALDSVKTGLEGVDTITGSLWTLLVSWAALRAGGLPKALNYLGMVIGVAGLLTVVPALEMLVFVFGLGGIVWMVWLGIVMLRSSSSAAVQEPISEF